MSDAGDNEAGANTRAPSPSTIPLPDTPKSFVAQSPAPSHHSLTPAVPSVHLSQAPSRVPTPTPMENEDPPTDGAAAVPNDPMPMLESLLSTMRQTLHTLTTAFDTLAYQSSQLATLRPAIEGHQEILKLKDKIAEQDQKMDQMRDFLSETLKGHMNDIREGLNGHVEEVMGGPVKESVRQEVEMRVMERVAEQIAEKIPPALLDTVQDHKVQLSEVRRSLHNSEARRANGLLRTNNINEPLTPLIRSNGEVSPFFPHDLSALFASPGPVAKQLVSDYDLPVDPESRERNLNKFMGHIGVGFQMVPAPPVSPTPISPMHHNLM